MGVWFSSQTPSDTVFRHRRLNVGEEFVDDEGALRDVDEMRAVVGEFLAERRGGGQKARVPAHDDGDIHPGESPIVEIGAGERLRHPARRRGKAGRVVVDHQIVVDGFWNVHRP